MPIFPVRHFEWQVLRTVKRSKTPPTGRVPRLVPSRRAKDGSFLTDLVDQGLLARVTGSAAAPFEATYSLTAKGEHAAEFGEADFPLKGKTAEPAKVEQSKPARKGKGVTRGK